MDNTLVSHFSDPTTSPPSTPTSYTWPDREGTDPMSHVERHRRCGRRPPMSPQGKTLWYPGPHVEDGNDGEHEGGAEMTAWELHNLKARQWNLERHAAETLFNAEIEADAMEARQLAAEHHASTAFDKPAPRPSYRRSRSSSRSKASAGSSRYSKKLVRFASDDGLVQMRIFDVLEDQEDLEDWFSDWIPKDKAEILGKSLLSSPKEKGATASSLDVVPGSQFQRTAKSLAIAVPIAAALQALTLSEPQPPLRSSSPPMSAPSVSVPGAGDLARMLDGPPNLEPIASKETPASVTDQVIA